MTVLVLDPVIATTPSNHALTSPSTTSSNNNIDDDDKEAAQRFLSPADRSYPGLNEAESRAGKTKSKGTTSRAGKTKSKGASGRSGSSSTKSKGKSNSDSRSGAADEDCSTSRSGATKSKGKKFGSGSRSESRSGVSGGSTNGKGSRQRRGLKGGKSKGTAGRSGVACVSAAKGVPDREYPPAELMQKSNKAAAAKDGDDNARGNAVKCAPGTQRTRRGRALKGSGSRGGAAAVEDGCEEEGVLEAIPNGGASTEYPPGSAGGGVVEFAQGDATDAGGDDYFFEEEVKDDLSKTGDEGDAPTITAIESSMVSAGDNNNTGKRVGFTMGMLGLVLISMIAVIVGVRRKNAREDGVEKFYASDMGGDDTDDDDADRRTTVSDDESFVYPSEDDLVGPEFDNVSQYGHGDLALIQSTNIAGDPRASYSVYGSSASTGGGSRQQQQREAAGAGTSFILEDLQGGDTLSVATPASRGTQRSSQSVSTRNIQSKNNTCCL